MNSLEERKQELLARSDAYRQAMAVDLRNIKANVFWIPRTIQTVRKISPILMIAAPLVGLLIGRRVSAKPKPSPEAPSRKGLLARVLGGIALYHKIKPILDVLRPVGR